MELSNSLRVAATNPLALIAFLATVIAWSWVLYRTKRLGLLLRRMEDVPKTKRSELIRQEMGVVIPDKISADEWIRSRKHQYFFVGYLALCFLALCFFAIAFWSGMSKRDMEKMKDDVGKMQGQVGGLRGDVDNVQETSGEQVRQLFDLQKQIATITGRMGDLSIANVEMKSLDAEQSRSLNALLAEFAEVSEALEENADDRRLSDADRQRLLEAEAAILRNRAILYVHEGRLDEAFGQLSKAIEMYRQDEDAFSEELVRALTDRGFVLYTQGKIEDASSDLADAKVLVEDLVENKGRNDLAPQLEDIEKGQGLIRTGASPGVKSERSALSSINVAPLTLEGMPPLSAAYAFQPGADRSSQMIKELGKPLLVPPGAYDIHCQPESGSSFVLVRNVQVADKQQVLIDTNREIAMLLVTSLPFEGLAIEALWSVKAGTSLESFSGFKHEFDQPFFVTSRESHDFVVKQAGGQFVKVATDITALPGRRTVVSANQETAVISVPNLGVEGLEIEAVYVLAPETPLTGYFNYVQKASGFDQPMLVRAGEVYDIFVKPKGGQLTRVAQNISAQPGQHFRVDTSDEGES